MRTMVVWLVGKRHLDGPANHTELMTARTLAGSVYSVRIRRRRHRGGPVALGAGRTKDGPGIRVPIRRTPARSFVATICQRLPWSRPQTETARSDDGPLSVARARAIGTRVVWGLGGEDRLQLIL